MSTPAHPHQYDDRGVCTVCTLKRTSKIAQKLTTCPGVPLQPYRTPLPGAYTVTTLARDHHRKRAPGQQPVGAYVTRYAPYYRLLYRLDEAVPVRPATPGMLAGRERAQVTRRTCACCGEVSGRPLTMVRVRQGMGRVCALCVVEDRTWTNVVDTGLEGIALDDPAVPAATLDQMAQHLATLLQQASGLGFPHLAIMGILGDLLALLPPGPVPPAAPRLLHVAEQLLIHPGLSPHQVTSLAYRLPFQALNLDGWAFVLLAGTFVPTALLAKLAVCHVVVHGTSRKNHWLARLVTRLNADDTLPGIGANSVQPQMPVPAPEVMWFPPDTLPLIRAHYMQPQMPVPAPDTMRPLTSWCRMLDTGPCIQYMLTITRNGQRVSVRLEQRELAPSVLSPWGKPTTVLLDIPDAEVTYG